MKPRFKVIADYPDSPFGVGQILPLIFKAAGWRYEYVTYEGQDYISESQLKEYPHLFKEMEWFEDRKKEDMPKYIKSKRTGNIGVVEKWNMSKESKAVDTYASVGSYCWFVTGIEPCTEQQYTDYVNQRNYKAK